MSKTSTQLRAEAHVCRLPLTIGHKRNSEGTHACRPDAAGVHGESCSSEDSLRLDRPTAQRSNAVERQACCESAAHFRVDCVAVLLYCSAQSFVSDHSSLESQYSKQFIMSLRNMHLQQSIVGKLEAADITFKHVSARVVIIECRETCEGLVAAV